MRVYDPAKAGIDAGALCGLPDTGITATDDRDALINADADVVLYMGKVETDTPAASRTSVTCSASGKNVVATGSRFVHPRSLDASLADGIETLAVHGNSSFLGLGSVPRLRR